MRVVAEQLETGLRQRVGLLLDDETGLLIADDLGGGVEAGDAGQPRAHGLDEHQAEPLSRAGHREDARARVAIEERRMIEAAEQVDLTARRLRQNAHPLAQAGGVVALADDPEHGVGLGRDHARPGVDQLVMPLVAIRDRQASHHQDRPIPSRRLVGRWRGRRRVRRQPRLVGLHRQVNGSRIRKIRD